MVMTTHDAAVDDVAHCLPRACAGYPSYGGQDVVNEMFDGPRLNTWEVEVYFASKLIGYYAPTGTASTCPSRSPPPPSPGPPVPPVPPPLPPPLSPPPSPPPNTPESPPPPPSPPPACVRPPTAQINLVLGYDAGACCLSDDSGRVTLQQYSRYSLSVHLRIHPAWRSTCLPLHKYLRISFLLLFIPSLVVLARYAIEPSTWMCGLKQTL